MQRPRTEKIIAWSLALVFIAVAWQLDFPAILRSLMLSWGVAEGSLLYHLLIDGCIAFIFVGISWGAIRAYEDILWRWWPWLGCKRGWWIYGLVAEHDKGISQSVKIVGLFYLLHTTTGTRIKEAHAFYLEEGQITPRGNWHSDLVWIGTDQIQFLFTMHSVRPKPEAVPSSYDGYLALSNTLYAPLVGTGSWKGYFYDLGDRRDITGGVYAEKLSAFRVQQANKAEQIMHRYAEELIKRVY